jgi:hypothetical protein
LKQQASSPSHEIAAMAQARVNGDPDHSHGKRISGIRLCIQNTKHAYVHQADEQWSTVPDGDHPVPDEPAFDPGRTACLQMA